MSIIEKTIDVNIPARTAYNQWTQFEEFPRFMDGVLEVRQLDDKRTHWPTNIGGIEKDFDAEITEQILDKGIAWRSRSGASNTGVVTLHSLNDQNARIMLQMFYEPEWIIEKRVVTCLASLPGDLRVASSDSKSSSSRKAARPGLGVVKSNGLFESFDARTRYVGAIRLPPIAGHLYRVRVITDQRRLVCPK